MNLASLGFSFVRIFLRQELKGGGERRANQDGFMSFSVGEINSKTGPVPSAMAMLHWPLICVMSGSNQSSTIESTGLRNISYLLENR